MIPRPVLSVVITCVGTMHATDFERGLMMHELFLAFSAMFGQEAIQLIGEGLNIFFVK